MASSRCSSSVISSDGVMASYPPRNGSSRRPCSYVYTESSRLPNLECLGFYLGKTLGSGTYAKVKAGWNITTGRLVAIKLLSKSAASREYLEKFLPREINILRRLHFHANILQCYQIIETEHQAIFIMELADNGDLLDYINSRRHIPEPESRCIFRQIANAIQFLHSHNIAHRDLKCENVLLGQNMEVKLGDFGFSMDMVNVASTPCGSYSYAAPELFELGGATYDPRKTDAWSIGVILYAMVCGRLPFGDDTKVKTLLKTDLVYTKPISADCRSLIDGILNPSPADRLTVTDVLLHSWTASAPVHLPTKLSEYPKYTPLGTLHRHTIDYIRRHADLKSQSGQVPPMDIHLPYLPLSPVPSPLHSHTPVSTTKQTHTLVARLGSYKRRLAEVVHRKSQDRQH